jgi:FkbM family methyltransferase
VNLLDFGPFESVFDVGGNVGDFSAWCSRVWPAARIVSFEPLPAISRENELRADGAWRVERVAVSSRTGSASIQHCLNQHSASTMQTPGPLRMQRFGITDRFETLIVPTRRLDEYLSDVRGRLLVKVDVEGHELEVIAGAAQVLRQAVCVVCEVNQEPTIFRGAPPPDVIDSELRSFGLYFAGVVGVQMDPAGRPVQFDGVWRR